MTRPSSIRGCAVAFVAAALLQASLPALAHEGHEHGAAARPVDVRLAPRFEMRGEDVEIVGVLADKTLLIYLDRATDNAPIQGARIEVEGQGIKEVASAMADGVYRFPAATLAPPGKYPLTITVQAGEIVDLLAVSLTVGEVAATASADGKNGPRWWLFAGIPLLLLSGGLIARRLRRQPKEGSIHHV